MKTFILIGSYLFSIVTYSQIENNSISDPGDIAIVAYHDSPDGFSFVFLDNCPINTEIRFIDEEWIGDEFNTLATEGDVLWTNNTGSTIIQGTVVHIENANDNSPGISASIGSAEEVDGGFSLALNDDEIIAITGTRSSPGTFLTCFGDSENINSTLLGTGLTDGANANFNTSFTEGYYNNSSNCVGLTISECSAKINNKNNWTYGSFTYPQNAPNEVNIHEVLSIKTKHQNNIRCYPNPVYDILSIKSKSPIKFVRILNTTGKTIFMSSYSSKDINLDLSKFTNGIYFIKTDTKTTTKNFRIIKK